MQERSHWGVQGVMALTTSISEPNSVQKFNDFYRVCYNFWTIYGGFSFFLTRSLQVGPSEKIRYLTLDLLKIFSQRTRVQTFDYRRNPGRTGKVLTREASYEASSGPQLNIIASILGLLKTFSEIIVASKCDPLARIGKQAVS